MPVPSGAHAARKDDQRADLMNNIADIMIQPHTKTRVRQIFIEWRISANAPKKTSEMFFLRH